MPDRIRLETENLLILDTNIFKRFFIGIVIIIFGLLIPLFTLLLMIGVIWFLMGFYVIIFNECIIINKQSQSMVIKKIINTPSINEIPFSNIKRIDIMCVSSIDPEAFDSWNIHVITGKGMSTKIYTSKDNSDAERVAGKIRNMIERKHYVW